MRHALISLATLLGGSLGLAPLAQAQGNYTDDALLYSRQGPAGTARTLGLGGANVALGGDFGSVITNPAGLGLFTKSEVSFTPGLGFGGSTSTPLANAASQGGVVGASQSANSFHVASLGIVFANRRPDNDNSSDWRGGSFALGFTRLADYNQGFRYQNVTNDDHSLFQYLREPGRNGDYVSNDYQNAINGQNGIADQYNSGNYLSIDGLAYGAKGGALTLPNAVPDPLNPNGPPITRLSTPLRRGPITQDEQILNKGSMSQFDLAYGGNYRDRLYIGGGIGITSLNRTRTSMYTESSDGGEDFTLQDNLKTTGTGINARLGLIYRVVDQVRLGASVQTPTYIQLQDTYSTTLISQYTPAGQNNVFTTLPGNDTYSVTTPFRANGGVAVVIGKYGFITGDVEYVGYGQTRFNTTGTNDAGLDFNRPNQLISNQYRNTFNFRVGAEARLDIFRARLGFASYGSPFANSLANTNRTQNYFTGGLGLRTGSFFLDVAGVYTYTQNQYSPYTLAADNPATKFVSIAKGVAPVIATDYHRFTVSLTGGLIF